MQSVQPDRFAPTHHTEPAVQSCEPHRSVAPPQRTTRGRQADAATVTRAQAAEFAVEELSASFGDITGQAAHDVMQDAPALAPHVIARHTSVLARERWTPEARGAQHAPPSASGVVQHLRHPSLQSDVHALQAASQSLPAAVPAPSKKRSFDVVDPQL